MEKNLFHAIKDSNMFGIKKALSIIALAAVVAAPARADELTIATWNLEHFSGQNSTGCNPRSQQDYDEIRKIITNVDADIWLFQEVESGGSLARIMDPSSYTFAAESRPERSSPGTCRDSGQTMTMQRTATAVRKGLMIGKPTDLSFLDVHGNGSLRYGLGVDVAFGGNALHIVNVHLKSGCPEGTSEQACKTIFEQIPYLASYINEVSARNSPVIVGGDFNRRLAKRGDEAFNTLGYNKMADVKISSITRTSDCSLKGEKGIDYILTNAALREALDVSETYEYTFTGPFKSWPSDHCPLIVKLTTK
jgi:endonuclease/exonuclease/phosphatase family metal-dependent hydrolase